MTEWAQRLMDAAGYPGLIFLMALENVFPPIPSEIVLPLTGFQVHAGSMHLLLAIITATVGSVIGSAILYQLARQGGRPLLLRHGRILRVTDRDIDKADRWFERFGSWTVFFGRMIPLARSIVSIPAGTLQMGWKRFLFLTTAGSAIWNTALITAGMALGNSWHDVGEAIDAAAPYVITAAFAALAATGVPRYKRFRNGTLGNR